MKNNQQSTINNQQSFNVMVKIIIIVLAIAEIVLITCSWLDVYQTSILLGDSLKHQYSLFEISEIVNTIITYISNSNVETYLVPLMRYAIMIIIFGILKLLCATIIIILGILKCIMVVSNSKTTKTVSIINLIVSFIVVSAFFGMTFYINFKVKNITCRVVDGLLITKVNPYLLIIMSVVEVIVVRIQTNKLPKVSANSFNMIKCSNCGAYIAASYVFCDICGTKLMDTPQFKSVGICMICGATVNSCDEYCGGCGNKI